MDQVGTSDKAVLLTSVVLLLAMFVGLLITAITAPARSLLAGSGAR